MRYLLLLVLLFAATLPAQTITRPLTLTLDTDKVDAIKLWIANRDGDSGTIDETDITNAAGLDYIQAELTKLVQQMQQAAIRQAVTIGRTDLLPAAYNTQVTSTNTQVDAQDTLETAGAEVQ